MKIKGLLHKVLNEHLEQQLFFFVMMTTGKPVLDGIRHWARSA